MLIGAPIVLVPFALLISAWSGPLDGTSAYLVESNDECPKLFDGGDWETSIPGSDPAAMLLAAASGENQFGLIRDPWVWQNSIDVKGLAEGLTFRHVRPSFLLRISHDTHPYLWRSAMQACLCVMTGAMHPNAGVPWWSVAAFLKVDPRGQRLPAHPLRRSSSTYLSCEC